MRTKIILHGGFDPKRTSEDNSGFYKEILKDTPQSSCILVVPFAKDPQRVKPSVARVIGEFDLVKEEKNVSFDVANEENFLKQIETSDIIYFCGGTSLRLLEVLRKYSDLKESLHGKVIAGESAGANALTRFFYTPSADLVTPGLGFLNIKMIPHYKEEYMGKLDDVGPNIEALLLPEYTFKVFVIIK